MEHALAEICLDGPHFGRLFRCDLCRAPYRWCEVGYGFACRDHHLRHLTHHLDLDSSCCGFFVCFDSADGFCFAVFHRPWDCAAWDCPFGWNFGPSSEGRHGFYCPSADWYFAILSWLPTVICKPHRRSVASLWQDLTC